MNADDDIPGRLAALVMEILGDASHLPTPFPVQAQLSELGVTSLKMVNLMLTLETRFKVAIPQAEITPENFQSLATMAALVERLVV